MVWVEGEKKAEAVALAGFTACSAPYGAARNDRADYSPLRGREVVLWADDDTPGREDALKVADKLVDQLL